MGCAYYFSIFSTYCFLIGFFSHAWSNVQLHPPRSIPRFNMILRVHEVLDWKTSTERISRAFPSISHRRKRRFIRATSSSYVLRAASSAAAPTFIIVTIYRRFSRKGSILRLPCNIALRMNFFSSCATFTLRFRFPLAPPRGEHRAKR